MGGVPSSPSGAFWMGLEGFHFVGEADHRFAAEAVVDEGFTTLGRDLPAIGRVLTIKTKRSMAS